MVVTKNNLDDQNATTYFRFTLALNVSALLTAGGVPGLSGLSVPSLATRQRGNDADDGGKVTRRLNDVLRLIQTRSRLLWIPQWNGSLPNKEMFYYSAPRVTASNEDH